ncbi:MAG: filamentous hemagglutinin N-terminal domain-containing protein [Phormidesmis sp.]
MVFFIDGLSAYADSWGVQPDYTTQTAISGGIGCAEDCVVSGGSRSGSNLFHSFRTFSIPENVTVTFTDSGAANIFARVSDEASWIDGTLEVTAAANFFLINPHGITFGSQALLLSAGSFVASTADSIVFSEGVFSVSQRNVPLLTVSTPIGLQFGDRPGAIINRSQAIFPADSNTSDEPSGLRVDPGRTLALVGSFVHLADGHLTANGGQIEIGSVAAGSKVSLSSDLTLGYEGVSSFRNILLTGDAFVDVSGEGGQIFMRGHRLTLADQSVIANYNAGLSTGTIDLRVDDSIDITGAGVFFSPLDGVSDGADLNVSAKRLALRAGAVIDGGTFGAGRGGSIFIEASESVELEGTSSSLPSLITTSTEGTGAGGNITIDTRRLAVRGGAQLQAVTYGAGSGGDLLVNASDQIEVSGTGSTDFNPETASGILASSGVATRPSQLTGNGGRLRLNTGLLSISEGAVVAVNSLGIGDAGNLEVDAHSVRLSGGARLTAAAVFGNGGNIRLTNLETLVLREGSLISARAGMGDGLGNGGNIDIEADFIVAKPLENSDIVASAAQGRGGNITINTRGLYGIAERRAVANNGTNDIDAKSDFGVSGLIAVSRLTPEADQRVVLLPSQPLETATLVRQGCAATGDRFIVTGRGGLPTVPTNVADFSMPLVDLGDRYAANDPFSSPLLENPPAEDFQAAALDLDSLNSDSRTSRPSTALETAGLAAPNWIEASGWTRNQDNQVVLIARAQQEAFSQQSTATCPG